MAQVRKGSARDRPTEITTELQQVGQIARSSSAGSIKRSIMKVPSEGLIVLPPDKELIKFENGGSSRTDYVSAVRGGSAGRVRRSLQMTRKKELEDENVSASGGNADVTEELQKGEKKCRPLKQTVEPDVKVGHEEEDSESSDSNSSDSDEPETNAPAAEGGTTQAPVELKGEFLKAVMDEDYETAKEICQKILLLEPDNKTCSEFHAVIVEKIKQGMRAGDKEDVESEESTEESSDDSEEDESQESSEDDQDSDEDDEENESNSDDGFTLPPGPMNLIMGGLPIRPQNR